LIVFVLLLLQVVEMIVYIMYRKCHYYTGDIGIPILLFLFFVLVFIILKEHYRKYSFIVYFALINSLVLINAIYNLWINRFDCIQNLSFVTRGFMFGSIFIGLHIILQIYKIIVVWSSYRFSRK